MTSTAPATVLDFWFAPEHAAFWFEKSAAFDAACVDALMPAHLAAVAGQLEHWKASADGTLALCILLDQLPRNAFRGRPCAFANDAQARAVARHALAEGFDLQTPVGRRVFLYLPFEHSEVLADQFLSEALFGTLGDKNSAFYAARHREIVERFGRFPHRNEALGRATTEMEKRFLEEPHSSF
jgi:uncharacterized protein (DUF924 family)